MNYPPTIRTVGLEISPLDDLLYQDDYDEQIKCVWEAAFCEWLIEQGLMPDPMEYMEQVFVVFREGEFAMPAINIRWECEDKTK